MTKVEKFKKVTDELSNLYEAKNKAYGNSFGTTYQKLGIISAVTRISDKYNRLCNLATNPDILLLDEPFSALDEQTKLLVNEDIYKIVCDVKKSVIMVTHDIAEAISMCDKVIVLSNRPATIKNIYNIEFENKSTPINNRKDNIVSASINIIRLIEPNAIFIKLKGS